MPRFRRRLLFHPGPGTACVLPECLYIRLRVCIVPVNRLWQWLCSLAPGNILYRGRNRSRNREFPLPNAVCPGSDSVWCRSLRIWCWWWIFLRFGCSSPVLWLILWFRFLRSRLPPEGVILVSLSSCIHYTSRMQSIQVKINQKSNFWFIQIDLFLLTINFFNVRIIHK